MSQLGQNPLLPRRNIRRPVHLR